MNAATAELVDAAAPEPVLVFGSPPPDGRDLDLLVRPAATDALRAALADAGFRARGAEWVRFGAGAAEAVDLVEAGEWSLPEPELAALMERAVAVPGYRRIVAPAAEHQLLILARRLQRGDRLSARALERGRAARGAWAQAEARARAWGVGEGLTALRAALDGRPEARGRRARTELWRLRHARVVALSGVDGCGKSSQAQALREALEDLGHEAVVVWNPLAKDPWVAAVGRPIRRVLGVLQGARRGPREPAPAPSGDERGLVANPASSLRRRVPFVNATWAALIAASNGVAHARLVARHARAGRVVIFDRYVLDSLVRLRFLYGEQPRFRLQRLLIRRLSPPAGVAVLFDVSAEESLRRKDDGWSRGELETQVRLYRGEFEALGVERLDGTRPYEELASELAELVWRRLL